MKLIIPGVPIPMKRPKLTLRGGYAQAYNPQLKQKNNVKATIHQLRPEKFNIDQNLAIHIDFIMPIPKYLEKKVKDGDYHSKKPDVDNLLKFILDCLNDIAFEDDSQVSILLGRKIYGSIPRTEITIFEISKSDIAYLEKKIHWCPKICDPLHREMIYIQKNVAEDTSVPITKAPPHTSNSFN